MSPVVGLGSEELDVRAGQITKQLYYLDSKLDGVPLLEEELVETDPLAIPDPLFELVVCCPLGTLEGQQEHRHFSIFFRLRALLVPVKPEADSDQLEGSSEGLLGSD